ncbi:DgyrCDS1760 [Dimorphilus gyrociliatus]|uniref:DgyrCDS1760 n=1 Tax=Dimorphilus gyrociliatus TaxID=2664684 RepID=A0A7I8V875_9ANNE|nr:DgyrCDS1760 [Dimorphilus gyrociliatus]
MPHRRQMSRAARAKEFAKHSQKSIADVAKSLAGRRTLKAGVANECAGLLAIYPGLPTRTPPNIQAILTLCLIPFTVLVRYLMIKQGISGRRMSALIVVIFGLVLSMIPIFVPNWRSHTPGINLSQISYNVSTIGSILWPCAFVSGYAFLALATVYCEDSLKAGESPMLYLTWMHVGTLLAGLVLLWFDLIPGFGLVRQCFIF